MRMMKYLIFGGPGIGDTIIELIIAQAIKSRTPLAKVDLLFSSTNGADRLISELLRYQNCIDCYYCYNKNKKLQTLRTLMRLKRNGYNYSFACSTVLKSNSKPALISRLIGTTSVIKEIKGKTGKIDIPVMVNENLHIVEQYRCLLDAVKIDYSIDCKVLDSSKLERFNLNNKSNRIIITLCLGTNPTLFYDNGKPVIKNIKEWELDRWCLLANKLTESGYFVVLIGGKKEFEAFQNVSAKYSFKSETCLCLAGQTSIGKSLSIISQSNLIVGADTGMMHCAAALGKPTLTLFGGTDPNIWKPFSPKSFVINGKSDCSPCYGKQYAINCAKRKCMGAIEITSVYKSIKDILIYVS
jgi:ADP-heptose:LPS heptosyltransferase